jgi:hypothetical protein
MIATVTPVAEAGSIGVELFRIWHRSWQHLPRPVTRFLVCGCLLTAVALWTAHAWAQPPGPAGEPDRAERLADMRQRVESVEVQVAGSDRLPLAKLVPEPLFRYSDEPRRIVDATLWCWQLEGRPVALVKIEKYASGPQNQPWLYCLASLSTELIQADWPDGQRFAARQPGLTMRPLPEAPPPAESPTARLSQMKQLSRRFTAIIVQDAKRDRRDVMRLLPQPIYRYASPQQAVVDGAIFGLTATGTNPDLLLAIEWHERPAGAAGWQYGLAGMTSGGLSVRLDDAEVWTAPFTAGQKGPFDTWLWFRAADMSGENQQECNGNQSP